MNQHIYLIGFMGTGKSTVSRHLKSLTGAKELDMDREIVRENDMSISDMFEQYGEEYFRDKETQMVQKIAAMEPAIVSCGGGAVLRAENVKMMKESGKIVLLTATPQTVYLRVRHSKDRPILNGHMNVEYIEELMEKRRAVYEKACDLRVATDEKTPEQIAREIANMVENADLNI
jgi:shikimate kinase